MSFRDEKTQRTVEVVQPVVVCDGSGCGASAPHDPHGDFPSEATGWFVFASFDRAVVPSHFCPRCAARLRKEVQ